MKFREFLQNRLNEVDEFMANNAKDWMKDADLPFSNIFGKNFRIIIPIQTQKMHDVKNHLEKKGFEVDFEKGTASRKVKTKNGDKDVTMRIGKVIKRELGKEASDWWSTSATLKKNNDHVIVLSRHPIDVLRMSDHQTWTSCHSPGDSYFHCAAAESKGQGLIAYLVKLSELKKVNLQDDEIFYDRDRGIDGIKPDGRIRVRRFMHNDEDYDLAIPEIRVYGKNTEGFYDSLASFLRTKQKNHLKERPDMDDFYRKGGSYQDNASSTLWNSFFQDDESIGDVNWEGDEEDEYEGMANQLEEEAQEFLDRYNFVNPVNAWHHVNEEANPPFLDYNGQCIVSFPKDEFLKSLKHEDWTKEREFKDGISKALSAAGWWYYGDLETHDGHGAVGDDEWHFVFDIHDEDSRYDADSYNSFLESLKEEWDDKYHELVSALRRFLVNNGYIKPSYLDVYAAGMTKNQFKNFKWTWDKEDGWLVLESEYSNIGNLSNNHKTPSQSWRDNKIDDPQFGVKMWPILEKKLKDLFSKILKFDLNQMMLPGFKRPNKEFFQKMFKPNVHYRMDNDKNIYFKLYYLITPNYQEAELKDVFKQINWIDSNYNEVVKEAIKIFNSVIKPEQVK